MVLKYVDLELEEVWQQYPEYKTQTITYAAFKAAILAHYPDTTGDYMYSLADIGHSTTLQTIIIASKQ